MRIILVGDVAQLPPVPDLEGVLNERGKAGLRKDPAKYAFESDLWDFSSFRHFRLTHCWRYAMHERLGLFLNEMRLVRRVPFALYEEMKALAAQNDVSFDEAIVLCCTNVTARRMSLAKLRRLPAPEYKYLAVNQHGPGGCHEHVCTEDHEVDNGNRGPTYQDENENDRWVASCV